MVKNLVGLRFGKLTVLEHLIIYKQKRNRQYCNCICDCGNTKSVDYYQLVNSRTESCGCIRLALITKHNLSRTKFYNIFMGIKQRCNNPKETGYHNYGGRGIKCVWNSFEEFYGDMFATYKPGLSIDRINNNGSYCKENCRWTDFKTQHNNKRTNHLVNYHNKIYTITQLAEKCNLSRSIIYDRLESGLTIEEAVEKPIKNKKILLKGVSLTNYCKMHNIPYSTGLYRYNNKTLR